MILVVLFEEKKSIYCWLKAGHEKWSPALKSNDPSIHHNLHMWTLLFCNNITMSRLAVPQSFPLSFIVLPFPLCLVWVWFLCSAPCLSLLDLESLLNQHTCNQSAHYLSSISTSALFPLC